MAIDWDFIAAAERGHPGSNGPVRRRGTPSQNNGAASGVDLAQYSDHDIDQLEIPDSLKIKLKPFTQGKSNDSGSSATFLGNAKVWPRSISAGTEAATPSFVPRAGIGTYAPPPADEAQPQLSDKEIKELEVASKKEIARAIIATYNQTVFSKPSQHRAFETLPSQIQTAILSFCLQFGEDCARFAHPDDPRRLYWDALTEQDWAKAVTILQTRFHESKDRRSSEARLIQMAAEPVPSREQVVPQRNSL